MWDISYDIAVEVMYEGEREVFFRVGKGPRKIRSGRFFGPWVCAPYDFDLVRLHTQYILYGCHYNSTEYGVRTYILD